MKSAEIVRELEQWFEARTGCSPSLTVEYIQAAGFDSFDVVELTAFAEKQFGIAFSARDFSNAQFTTITGLAAIIAAHLERTAWDDNRATDRPVS